MEFLTITGNAARKRTGCAVVGVFAGKRLSAAATEVDKATSGLIKRVLRRGDLSGKIGQTLLLADASGASCERILLVGCGNKSEFNRKQYRRALTAAAAALSGTGSRDVICYLSQERIKDTDKVTAARHGVEAVIHALYRESNSKTSKKETAPALKKVAFAFGSKRDADAAKKGIKIGEAIAEGVNLARDLGNLPANICTPTYLAQTARKIARGKKTMEVKVLGEAEMKRLGMGALLSVTEGSKEPAKLIVMRYRGTAARKPPIALVGKGITFDSGGISLKPAPNLDEMKFDMCGAASVLATIMVASRLRLPLNLVGVVPACENMPGGRATKPGDIVTSMSGQTIEILNTDAEGRLILCDALTYARKFKPSVVIDVATLTGACVIALGVHLTGLMSGDDKLAESLLAAGKEAEDIAWRMPLAEEYGQQLKSRFADFANVGGREGGAVTAACFLSKFTRGIAWAHLDIAGTAWRSGVKKGGTGRPVPLLVQYLLSQA